MLLEIEVKDPGDIFGQKTATVFINPLQIVEYQQKDLDKPGQLTLSTGKKYTVYNYTPKIFNEDLKDALLSVYTHWAMGQAPPITPDSPIGPEPPSAPPMDAKIFKVSSREEEDEEEDEKEFDQL